MAISETIAHLRKEHGLTQEQLAAKLYVTRQAVSRWERGEVVPGIDMIKLIATVLGEPLASLIDFPERYCQSCGMILEPGQYGTDASGKPNDHYCKWCYDKGEFTYETTMEAMIEDCAPRLAQNTGMSPDEAVSLMGAVLPTLKRWSSVHAGEMRYGKEARERYGDDAVDAVNNRLMDMDDDQWESREALEAAIVDELKLAFAEADPMGPRAQVLAAMHAKWIEMSWGEGAYSSEAHLALVRSYLSDCRFADYYDSRAGEGATEFLVEAVEAWHRFCNQ